MRGRSIYVAQLVEITLFADSNDYLQDYVAFQEIINSQPVYTS